MTTEPTAPKPPKHNFVLPGGHNESWRWVDGVLYDVITCNNKDCPKWPGEEKPVIPRD